MTNCEWFSNMGLIPGLLYNLCCFHPLRLFYWGVASFLTIESLLDFG